MELNSWQFWIDRGGTFTDVVARRADGQLLVHKLLSENPDCYEDAVLEAITRLTKSSEATAARITAVKIGTTIATNALLQRQGARCVLLITGGFKDALRIAYQNRPQIFALQIQLPELLYEQVIEVAERITASGDVLLSPNLEHVAADLQIAYQAGIRSCAIVLMHAYRYNTHEVQIAQLARQIGFTQISVSHEINPVMKLISRGQTTVVDAYLSPVLKDYVDKASLHLSNTALLFMQSNGGLIDAQSFQGKDSILSGPAGGIIGAVKTATAAGFKKIITFDMGGTSTDVSHFAGEYERSYETEIAGIRLTAPMMSIHTVAAGGGSILHFDGMRFRVGPDSAGARPGPACYRQDGPLTVTDCNLLTGKLQRQYFPAIFGASGNLPLDKDIVLAKFQLLANEIESCGNNKVSLETIADGFLSIAIDNMASAIKKISTERGYDLTDYTLACFGGAGGQHACLLAEALGIKSIYLHPYAGVLSAYGIGLADFSVLKQMAVEAALSAELLPQLETVYQNLEQAAQEQLQNQITGNDTGSITYRIHIKYAGTDAAQVVTFGSLDQIIANFEQAHKNHYGFIVPGKSIVVESVSVELLAPALPCTIEMQSSDTQSLSPLDSVKLFSKQRWWDTPIYSRQHLPVDCSIDGPAILIETTGTNVIEPGWRATTVTNNGLLIEQIAKSADQVIIQSAAHKPDPIMLEIFNNLFMSVAEQMGLTLQNTSHSVNIKERLDFSCALFDGQGELIANAPHIPVHLGSMGESVLAVLSKYKNTMTSGDVYVLNNPYNGGTHLPDVTVITPVFVADESQPLFFTASRGHHADIGGITPGSMPPDSVNIEQEGILIDNVQLVKDSHFCQKEMVELLSSGPYPARNVSQNLSDLKAQIAANERGVREIQKMLQHYGLPMVQSYMQHVKDNAEEAVRRAITNLNDGSFTCSLDDGSKICVAITVHHKQRTATIDFTGSSIQSDNNLNAPKAICKAAVLYVFRTLVNDDIPLNAGCLKPLTLIIPEGSILNPEYPAAVVAGNVETSQAITDALYAALGIMAASQGTMNNFTFGDQQFQYYETICGGSGAGSSFDGIDAVHTHMTNSRLTDPEVLEWRFPVMVEEFSIRPGSGGAGKYRGGNGVIRKIRFRKSFTAAILSTRRQIPPFGLQGGQSGKCGLNWVERADGRIETLSATAKVQMNPGDAFVIETPGGGGYGQP